MLPRVAIEPSTEIGTSSEEQLSFKDYVIVSCGTLALELNYLRKQGFLDAEKIVYTTPGRHETPKELESQLIQKINTAKQNSKKIIIVLCL